MGMCKECGNVVATSEIDSGYCRDCYRPEKVQNIENSTVVVVENNSLSQILGVIGAIILVAGVFAPLIRVPFLGSVDYFLNGKGDGVFILGLGIISLLLVLIKQYKWLWLTGFGGVAMLIFTFFQIQTGISQLKTDMEINLAGNPFRGFADAIIQSVQIQWGFALLAVGCVLLIISAAKN